MEESSKLHVPATLPPGEIATGTHWIGYWVDPRASLDALQKKISGFNRKLKAGPPARSPSLYRLNYPYSVPIRPFHVKMYNRLLIQNYPSTISPPVLPLNITYTLLFVLQLLSVNLNYRDIEDSKNLHSSRKSPFSHYKNGSTVRTERI
jgi:hypothetical protein